jgi:hypothetical protein
MSAVNTKSVEVKPTKKLYAVWETDGNSGYYAMYDTMEDAVSSCSDLPVELFEINPKSLGLYKTRVALVKAKPNKK